MKKGKIFTSFFTIFFLFCYSSTVFPLEKTGRGNIIGYIFGPDKTTPISGAVVKAKNVKDSTTYTSSPSDSQGAFKVEGMKEGIYIIGIRTAKGGYNTEAFVGIKENQTAKVSFSLNPYEENVASAIQGIYRDEAPKRKERQDVYQEVYREPSPSREVRVGKVLKYISETREASVIIEEGLLRTGDRVHINGYVTDFYKDVKKLSIDGVSVKKALAGQTVLLTVVHPVETGDFVYLILKKRGLAAFFLAPCGIASVLAGSTGIIYKFIKLKEEPEKSPFKK